MTKTSMLRPLGRDCNEWTRVWNALALALNATPLPANDEGGLVTCVIEDFMLVGIGSDGKANFKNIGTRRYLLLDANGALSYEEGAAFYAFA